MGQPLGVQYSPDVLSNQEAGLKVSQFKDRSISFVRIQWVDYINCVHFRVLPVSYFKRLLDSPRPGINVPMAVFVLVVGHLLDGYNAAGEFMVVPDLNTLKECPYAPGHASIMGWFETKAPQPGCDRSLALKVDLCPRGLLHRIESDAKSLGIEFLVGFETEFTLLTSTSPITPVCFADSAASAGLPTGAPHSQALEEMSDALEKAGIEVQMFHGEGAPGQFEIATGPLTPLAAADALVHTRETIYNIALKHKLRATLAPRVFPDRLGSSCHAHISVHSKSPSPVSAASPHLTEVEASFLSNVLARLPALCALILPTPASYLRMRDDIVSGGTYVCWGTEHREAPIRLCNATSPSSRNFEVRPLDGTANPYLALAGILGAGLEGVKKQSPLTVKDCGHVDSAAKLSENARRELGITERMSLSLEDALAKFGSDMELRRVLGDNVVDVYLKTTEALAAHLSAGSQDAALLRLIERY